MTGLAGGGLVPLALVTAYVWIVIWMIAESQFLRFTRKAGAPPPTASGEDRGSVFVVVISLWVAMGATFGFYFVGITQLSLGWVIVLGSLVVGSGIFVRGWALITLGRFFSLLVRTTVDQQLITKGPYRWIRHPAYTGNLLIAVGVSLILGTLLGILVTSIVVLAGHLYRIRVEEEALRRRFSREYEEYIRRTWRLIPGLF